MLYSHKGIIEKATPYKKPIVMGVYFLINKGNIVYVGSCDNIHKRITVHYANKKAEFTDWFFEECLSRKEMKNIEIEYIKKFTPKYNIKHNIKAEEEMKLAIDLARYKTQKNEKHVLISRYKVDNIFKEHNMETFYKKLS